MTALPATTRGLSARAPTLLLVLALGCNSTTKSSTNTNPSPDLATAPEATAAISPAAHDAAVRAPMDATPSPDGTRIYYTALQRTADAEDVPGVFTTLASGGAIDMLSRPGAFTAPVSISVSLDGAQLFVADPAAGDTDSAGAILSLPSGGGDASAVPGTEGYSPNGVSIAEVDHDERLYFTGRDPMTGRGGLFRIAASGGMPESLLADGVLDAPGAVAVDAHGTAYVVDAAPSSHVASLFKVGADGHAKTLASGIGVGFPAGVALTRAGTQVLVSGIDPRSQRDVVYVIDAENGKLSLLSKPFHDFTEAAGLHRAHRADVFAWADSEADASGTVYVVTM